MYGSRDKNAVIRNASIPKDVPEMPREIHQFGKEKTPIIVCVCMTVINEWY
jgi:hypothetical protein